MEGKGRSSDKYYENNGSQRLNNRISIFNINKIYNIRIENRSNSKRLKINEKYSKNLLGNKWYRINNILIKSEEDRTIIGALIWK